MNRLTPQDVATSSVRVMGVRHHGPGSARSVRKALEALAPSLVLVEGPPDADGMIPLIAHADMTPPVALLVYRPDEPRASAHYPFAEFSPEWQALRYAAHRGIPARFMDLPVAHQLGPDEPDPEISEEASPPRRMVDPLGKLAEAAGFDDGERWWEFVVEGRRDGHDLFAAILDAMGEVRRSVPPEDDPRELRREAYMRQTIRAAIQEGHGPIAVICGAWHAPALAESAWPPAKDDAAILKGLPRAKVSATWVPWTDGTPGARQRIRRGDRLPGLVRSPVDRTRPRGRAMAHARGPPAPRRASGCVVRLGDRGRPPGRRPGHDEGKAACRPLGPGRGGADGPVLRRGDAHAADPPQARGGRAAGPGPGLHADRPLAAGLEPLSEAIAARAGPVAGDQGARPPRADRPGTQPPPASTRDAWRRVGPGRACLGQGDVQGGVAAPVGARARRGDHRGERLGRDGRGRRPRRVPRIAGRARTTCRR